MSIFTKYRDMAVRLFDIRLGGSTARLGAAITIGAGVVQLVAGHVPEGVAFWGIGMALWGIRDKQDR